MSGTHDLGGEVQAWERGLHLASREHGGVQWRGPVLVVGAEANRHGFIDGSREGSLSEMNIDVVQSLPVWTNRAMADTVSSKKIDGEESDLARSPSTKDAERREESKYTAGA